MDTISTNFNSEETDQGLEIMGRQVRKLIIGIQDLRHLGVEGLVNPLPKIAVVGDQSSGKSSLIEGIRYVKLLIYFLDSSLNSAQSGIRVPRDDDTCTRVC